MRKDAYIWCLVAMLCLPVLAKSQNQEYQLQWTANQERAILGKAKIACPSFVGASYHAEEGPLPWFSTTLPLSGRPAATKATLVKPVYEEMPAADVAALKGVEGIGPQALIESRLNYSRKKPVAAVHVMPIRRNKATGRYERLVSFTVKVSGQGSKSIKKSSRVFATKSVLASGDWYKVSVSEDGIYQLTYEALAAKGIPVQGVGSSQLRLFGNGGGVLPYNNSEYRHDDLQENAIQIEDGGDGVFGPGDYILFYGQASDSWTVSSDIFVHSINEYSDSTYYFFTLNYNVGPPKRINLQASESSSTVPVTSFSGRDYYEVETSNLIKSGREWYGDQFGIKTSDIYTFNFPFLVSTEPVTMRYQMAGRSINGATSFQLWVGSQSLDTVPISATQQSYSATYAFNGSGTSTFFSPSSEIEAEVRFIKPPANPNATGWLNYLEFNARQELRISDNQLFFRDLESLDASGNTIGGFQLQTDGADLTVWDVTDPVNVKRQQVTASGGTLTFNRRTNQLLEFAAFKSSGYATPNIGQKIENQNLHGSPQSDMIIVTAPEFLTQSMQLADLHRRYDDLSVVVATTDQIYNEFSSGAQDITAIKDFARMFYDRAGTDESNMPKYLLLYGDASYDYKDRTSGNTNFVPTYESAASLSPITSYATDDYFGLLDEEEGERADESVDLGIGRLMVRNASEADAVLNKIQHYYTSQTLGPWRNYISFVGDDEDEWDTAPLIHMTQADSLAKELDTTYNWINFDKIMFDAYQQVSGAGGARYPDVNDAIESRMTRGALLMSYTGHGGEAGWAHERVLTVPEINGWENKNNMPLLLTATCEFSRYDDPLRTSGGELALLNPDGGAIGLMTTTRLVTAWDNFFLARAFFRSAFEKVDGEMPRLGDIYRITKLNGPQETNSRKFCLLGDPAMRLAYPKHKVVVTSFPDTLRPLEKVTARGYIANQAGEKLNDFNGVLFPLIFDQPSSIVTLDNENWGVNFKFNSQSNVIFRGKASVTNGEFEFSFVVPRDLAPVFGTGRASFYAENGQEDATGAFEDFTIGGQSNQVNSDSKGPDTELYMNDDSFVFGGLTDEDPDLLAHLFDENGINTSSAGIGHDLVAFLDENTADAIVLNDFYESDLDSYTTGTIRYPFDDLSEGRHKLRIRVWDVNNNPTDASTEFVVASGADLALDHILNYPNPFTTHTDFYFNHNQPGQELFVRIQVFTVSGKLVKTIDGRHATDGFRVGPIPWDGRDEFGDAIGRGVYVYKVKVTAPTGKSVDEFEKLVILN